MQWANAGKLEVENVAQLRDEQQVLIIIGPGGTGKTSILRMAEALIDYFAGPESVRKCAISNTAARLLKGDTLHALCKLPLKDLQNRMGKLTPPVLKKHRKRWKSAKAMFLDEISMVAPDQLLQADVRLRQARGDEEHSFGNLICVFTGDFLQLPPVKKKTLATKMDEQGLIKRDDGSSDDADQERAEPEVRQGF